MVLSTLRNTYNERWQHPFLKFQTPIQWGDYLPWYTPGNNNCRSNKLVLPRQRPIFWISYVSLHCCCYGSVSVLMEMPLSFIHVILVINPFLQTYTSSFFFFLTLKVILSCVKRKLKPICSHRYTYVYARKYKGKQRRAVNIVKGFRKKLVFPASQNQWQPTFRANELYFLQWRKMTVEAGISLLSFQMSNRLYFPNETNVQVAAGF